ncbi:TlpA family protein disulfide reductase [Salicibibacter halophilus]|uniref:TlpA family protein disulfide reductase n=1 Tax=Salicibibacter halophilus TaxID=2502791 RepID=A0A514LDS7_9BACI|nr:TlpA disulfide reductase family protein [Salicibibacter halophilus]QDI89999.1 TlpA family protein disulfide reductase [Salicibibacter halophilus]
MKQAPAFSVYDPYLEKEMTNDTYKGRRLVLTFWTSWCPDSHRDLQRKEALYAQTGNNAFDMLNINVTGRERANQAGRKYARAHEMKIPMAEDQGTDTYERYQCQGVPTTVFITPDGKIAEQFGDKTPFEEIMKHLPSFLDETSNRKETGKGGE